MEPDWPEKTDRNGLADFFNGIHQEQTLASCRTPDIHHVGGSLAWTGCGHRMASVISDLASNPMD